MATTGIVCLFAVPNLWTQGEKALALRPNVVKISAAEGGFGFIIAERNQQLLVVTAEHVVLGNPPSPDENPSVVVVFYTDQGTKVPAQLLKVDPPHDLALLRLKTPTGFAWEKECLARAGDAKRLTDVWFIGRDETWYVPALKGAIASDGPDADSWLEADMPGLHAGSSGGPLVTSTGIVGMVKAGNAEDVRVLSMDYIKKKVEGWEYSWDLTAEGEAPVRIIAAPPSTSGPRSALPFRALLGGLYTLRDGKAGACLGSNLVGGRELEGVSLQDLAGTCLFRDVAKGQVLTRDDISAHCTCPPQ